MKVSMKSAFCIVIKIRPETKRSSHEQAEFDFEKNYWRAEPVFVAKKTGMTCG